MSRWYRFMYLIGFTPWEQDTEVVERQLRTLLDHEESMRESSYGFALDLGCGTGRWSVELARRGWDVVGVDIVPSAIRAARKRAQETAVEITFVEGNVTALSDGKVGSEFSFFLDVECFNHLNDTQRKAVGREINAVATSDATMLMLVWTRARRGPLPPGASREDIEAAMAGWEIRDEYPYAGEMPPMLKSASPRWYRLSRT